MNDGAPARPAGVRVPRAVIAEIEEHARIELPNECCGLLIGEGDRVARSVRTRNLRASPTGYLVDPNDHFAAIRAARAEGHKVIGGYHSHPASAPVPSITDIAEAHDPDFVHLILAPGERPGESEVRAFRFMSDGFEVVAIVPVD
jgi:proteasome lid subunit RPN8/RPN11